MNRKLLLICSATLPVFLLAVVFQAIRYQDLKHEVDAKAAAQYAWVEKNKKAFAGVTVLRAPGRIEALAEADPGLQTVGADRTLKIKFLGGNQGAHR